MSDNFNIEQRMFPADAIVGGPIHEVFGEIENPIICRLANRYWNAAYSFFDAVHKFDNEGATPADVKAAGSKLKYSSIVLDLSTRFASKGDAQRIDELRVCVGNYLNDCSFMFRCEELSGQLTPSVWAWPEVKRARAAGQANPPDMRWRLIRRAAGMLTPL